MNYTLDLIPKHEIALNNDKTTIAYLDLSMALHPTARKTPDSSKLTSQTLFSSPPHPQTKNMVPLPKPGLHCSIDFCHWPLAPLTPISTTCFRQTHPSPKLQPNSSSVIPGNVPSATPHPPLTAKYQTLNPATPSLASPLSAISMIFCMCWPEHVWQHRLFAQ